MLSVESTRGDLVESVHEVHAVVTDAAGQVFMKAGPVDAPVFWRSAAKPFQAITSVQDGAADRFGFTPEELALACASHSSEPLHRQTALGMLAKVGAPESALACGAHPPLSARVDAEVRVHGTAMTPCWSNCSGKHSAMLGLATHHGWALEGYERSGHPVQQRILDEVARWCELPATQVAQAVDGCNTVCFGVPLRAMAGAYARLGASEEPAARRIVQAMSGRPWFVAGTGRLCTDLMAAAGGRLVAKFGAEGVYCVALPEAGLGLALKVRDGSFPVAGIALLGLLRSLDAAWGLGLAPVLEAPDVLRHGPGPILNTRGRIVGERRLAGVPGYSAPPAYAGGTASGRS